MTIAVHPTMICCKQARQQAGLACDAGHMACCLAGICSRQPSLEKRKEVAIAAASVEALTPSAFVSFVEQVNHQCERAGKPSPFNGVTSVAHG